MIQCMRNPLCQSITLWWVNYITQTCSLHSPNTWGQLRWVVCYEFVHLFSGASDGWETLSQSFFERHGAPHCFASSAVCTEKKKRGWYQNENELFNTSSCNVACIHTHFSDCILHTAKLGKFIDAFFFDDRAVHVEAHSVRSPEELLCLRECRHRAGKRRQATWDTLVKEMNSSGRIHVSFEVWFCSCLVSLLRSPECSRCLKSNQAANASIEWNTYVQTFLHHWSVS